MAFPTTTLSRHINGHSSIASGYLSAYVFFFRLLEMEKVKGPQENQLDRIESKIDAIGERIDLALE